jgi:SAM-dependent methyltransferase
MLIITPINRRENFIYKTTVVKINKETTELIEKVYQDYKANPVDLLGIDDSVGEFNYVSNLKGYYERTIFDIDDLLKHKEKSKIKILEIGSYLGFVSITLSKMGYKMTASDLDIFMQNKNLQHKYQINNICFLSFDLKNPIPILDETFDCVIMCETLEHLNFNPIPVLQEINRILVPGGYFYLALPNLCSLENRLKLLNGKSIHNSIDDFFAQLNPNCNFSVGLHWREYTKEELVSLLLRTGFESLKHSFFHPWDLYKLPLKFYVKSLWHKMNMIYIIKRLFPTFKSNQTIICKKSN